MVVIKLTKTMKLIVSQQNFQLLLYVMLQKQHLLIKVTNQLEPWQSLSKTWQNRIRLSMISWSSLCIISIELMSICGLYHNWKHVLFPKNKEVLIMFLLLPSKKQWERYSSLSVKLKKLLIRLPCVSWSKLAMTNKRWLIRLSWQHLLSSWSATLWWLNVIRTLLLAWTMSWTVHGHHKWEMVRMLNYRKPLIQLVLKTFNMWIN